MPKVSGLSASYKYRWMAADVGSTPLGFRVQNVVGGLELSPELADGVRLRTTVERRPVTDSLLSYAGTVDTGTGQTFGGVVRNRGHTQLELTAGLANFYAGGGYSQLTGHNVETNTETELGAGGSYPIYRNGSDELRAGLDLVYFTYAKNLDHFTLGQGGYFSPQSYFARADPADLHAAAGEPDLVDRRVGGRAELQREQLAGVSQQCRVCRRGSTALAAGERDDRDRLSRQTRATGVVGGAHGSIEYRVSPSLRIGGLVRLPARRQLERDAGFRLCPLHLQRDPVKCEM